MLWGDSDSDGAGEPEAREPEVLKLEKKKGRPGVTARAGSGQDRRRRKLGSRFSLAGPGFKFSSSPHKTLRHYQDQNCCSFQGLELRLLGIPSSSSTSRVLRTRNPEAQK
eukprot:28257-Rhodomonas_salina.3